MIMFLIHPTVKERSQTDIFVAQRDNKKANIDTFC